LATHNPEHTDEEALRARLATLEGIEDVLVDPARRQVWGILQAGADPHKIEEHARALVEPYSLELAVRPERRDRERVRFIEVRRELRSDQQSEIRVLLEWGGRDHEGLAIGDSRGALELRTAALAALDAVTRIVPGEMQVRLAGVKQVRAFDEDLIIVSLYRATVEPRNLVGVVVKGEDPLRAAAVAVLSALNRLLGNYLQLQ
jgi:hypothetical protein